MYVHFLFALLPSLSVPNFVLLPGAQPPVGEAKPSATVWDHRGSVQSLAFTRDGQRLIVGGASRPETVVVYDAKTGRRLQGIKVGELVYSIALAPDGKKAAVASYTGIDGKHPQGVAGIWDLSTGKELLRLKGNQGPMGSCIAWSPDGRFLATDSAIGKDDNAVGAVQLWDAATGKALDLFRGPGEAFGRLTFSPDGKWLAGSSFGAETFVVIWDVAARKQHAILKSRTTWALIRSTAFSADSKHLAWAAGNEVNNNHELFVWDVASAQRLAALPSDMMMASAFFGMDGKSLIAVGAELGIQTWNTASRKKSAAFAVAESEIPEMATAAALAADGKTLVIGTGNSDVFAPPQAGFGRLRLFDATTGRERLSPEGEVKRAKEEANLAVRLAAEAEAKKRREAEKKQELAKLSPEFRARLDDAQQTIRRQRYALHLNQAHQAIERGQFLAAQNLLKQELVKPGESDLRGFEWHYLWGQCRYDVKELEHEEVLAEPYSSRGITLSPDGKVLAVLTADHRVALWDTTTGQLRAILKDAKGALFHLAFSPDSRLLVGAGGVRDNSYLAFQREKDELPTRAAYLWDAASGKLLLRLPDDTSTVTCLTMSEDSRSLAIANEKGTARVFDVPSGKPTKRLSAPSLANCIALSPDAKSLAIGSEDGHIRLWTFTDGKEYTIRSTDKYGSQILTLQFSSDGRSLYDTGWVGNLDGRVDQDLNRARRWDLGKLDELVPAGEWRGITRVTISPDSKQLALTGWKENFLWDAAKNRLLARLPGDGLGSKLVFSPSDKTLIADIGSPVAQSQVISFDSDTGKRLAIADTLPRKPEILRFGADGNVIAIVTSIHRPEYHKVWIHRFVLGQDSRVRHYPKAQATFGMTSITFSRDGGRLALSDSENVFIVNLQNGNEQKVFQSGSMPIRKVMFDAEDKTVIATYPSGVELRDAATGAQRANIRAMDGQLGAHGKSIFASRGNGTIRIFSAADGKLSSSLTAKGAANGQGPEYDDWIYDNVQESPGSRWIIGFGSVLFDAAAKKPIKHWQRDALPTQFAFAPDDKTLVTGDKKGTVTIWELPGVIERFVIQSAWVTDGVISIAPDSRTAAMEQTDGGIALFDLTIGTERARLAGLSAKVRSLAFSPEGKSLVTGSADGTLQFWCPVTGAQRLNLRGHTAAITALAFSPDGATLATGSADSTLRLWSATPIHTKRARN